MLVTCALVDSQRTMVWPIINAHIQVFVLNSHTLFSPCTVYTIAFNLLLFKKKISLPYFFPKNKKDLKTKY